MGKCKYYNIKQVNHDPEPYYDDNFQLRYKYRYIENIAICNGTKECDPCSCGGNIEKCDFYKNIRKEIDKMNTAEMWLKAQKDDKTYVSVNLIYNKSTGFIWDDNSDAEELNETWTRSSVLNEDGWELASNMMTKEEAEEKFNIKIVG